MLVEQVDATADDRNLQLRPAAFVEDRYAIFAGARDTHRSCRRVDLQTASARGAGDDGDAAAELTDERARQHVDRGVVVDVQDGAIAEEDFGAAALGPQAVANVDGEIGLRFFGRGVAFQHDAPLNVRDVGRRSGLLRVCVAAE